MEMRERVTRVVVAAAAAAGAERFAGSSSSITDYLRYWRPGSRGGGGAGSGVCGGELQTAVRYEKRFPWSLLHPFLHHSTRLVTKMRVSSLRPSRNHHKVVRWHFMMNISLS
uniref:Uncharacterized protein n=1 Tax=Leersia perrieri TaxID=77586 RepID=A0A0D9X7I9_9ORYZ